MRWSTRIRTVGFVLLAAVVFALARQAPPLEAGVGVSVPIVINGQVTLQRPNAPAPDPSWVVPLTLSLYPPGQTTPVYTWQTTTDEWGAFSLLETFEPGTYDVRVKNPHTLRNLKQNVAFVAGTNTLDMGLLREGDANDDNRVNVADFAILRAAYFTEEGQPDFDPRADFDEDNRINVRDFALLRSNYFAEGDILVPRVAPLGQTHPVGVTIRPPVARGAVGEPITLTVFIETGTAGVVGADVVLTFDPAHLQVVDATGAPTNTVTVGDAFDTVLKNEVDNAEGRITFGAGTFGSPVQGQHTLFSFYVQASDTVFSTPIDIAYLDVVDANGRSLAVRGWPARVQAGDFRYQYVVVLTRGRWPGARVYVPLLWQGAQP